MIAQLALSTVMVALTVVIHGLGLIALARAIRLETHVETMQHVSPQSLRGMAVTLGIVLALFALHGIEIWLYAFLYDALDAVHGLENAVYFSTITYGAIGYSDHAMAGEWRLVSAIEGINGIILIGWSTAFFVTVVARLGKVGR
jgi:hypothetical protein